MDKSNSLFEQIDSYCERVDFAFLGEPLNFFSNLAFIFSALLVHIKYQSPNGKLFSIRQKSNTILIALIYFIGIGSALFHSFANRATMILDVTPIGIFIIFYLWHWLKELMHFSHNTSLAILSCWLIITLVFTLTFKKLPLGGSESYLGVGIFLYGMAFFQRLKKAPKDLFYAAHIFVVSLVFRSIDPYICPIWPNGTHFLWHLCNSAVLYFSMLNTFKIQKTQAALR